MNAESETPRDRLDQKFDDLEAAQRESERANQGWRWWARVGAIIGSALLACLLIVFGAVRFLDQAQQEHDKVECVRIQVQAQARGNSIMASTVLDAARPQAERANAVARWRDEQADVAEAIGRC